MKTNRYELKNPSYDKLKHQRLTKWIISIIQVSEKEWLTKSEIHNKGKDIYGESWHKDPDTTFRHLNTLSRYDIGILEKQIEGTGLPNRWRIRDSPYHYDELVIENEIENLKDVSKEIFTRGKEDNKYCDIIVGDKITIYGFPSRKFKEYDEKFTKIKNKMEKAMTELYQLTVDIRHRFFQERIIELFGIDKSSLDFALSMIFIYCFGVVGLPDFKKLWAWFDIGERQINVKLDIGLAKELKINFYPYLEIEDILGMLKNYHFGEELEDHLHSLFFEYCCYVSRITDLVVVLHGGVFDRGIKLNSSFKNWFNYGRKVPYMNEVIMKYLKEESKRQLKEEDEKRRAKEGYKELSLSEWIDLNKNIFDSVKDYFSYGKLSK